MRTMKTGFTLVEMVIVIAGLLLFVSGLLCSKGFTIIGAIVLALGIGNLILGRRLVLMTAGICTEPVTEENPFIHPVLLPTGDGTPGNIVEEWLGLDFDCVDENGKPDAAGITTAVIFGPIFTLFGILVGLIAPFVFALALWMLLGPRF